MTRAVRSLVSIATQPRAGNVDCGKGRSRARMAWNIDALLFGLAACSVPMSIALTESLLAGSLLFRLTALARGRAKVYLPRVFWFWLAWAALEVGVWLGSPELRAGEGEMRHLLLIVALFLLVPTLSHAGDLVMVWRGIVLAASISSIILIGHFASRLLFYRGTLDPVVYLRSGGLLHHWAIYSTVEILVLAALLELWRLFPEERPWSGPVLVINTVAIVLSLTRMLWICSLILLVVQLFWMRSRWLWATPLVPCLIFVIAPRAVRSRVTDSMHLDYYSNAERIQMIRVGWKIIKQHPLTGVGPGRVEELYVKYLSPSDPIPAYHGHLHNTLIQLAAGFGLPATMAAVLFVAVLFRDLRNVYRRGGDREQQFLCRTAVLGLTGFVVSGLFDYTYGHSLGIILLGFTVFPPLMRPLAESEAGATRS